jgi:K+-transporting ATPase A subunit
MCEGSMTYILENLVLFLTCLLAYQKVVNNSYTWLQVFTPFFVYLIIITLLVVGLSFINALVTTIIKPKKEE